MLDLKLVLLRKIDKLIFEGLLCFLQQLVIVLLYLFIFVGFVHHHMLEKVTMCPNFTTLVQLWFSVRKLFYNLHELDFVLGDLV